MTIPDELLDAPAYNSISAADRVFLIDLYVLFGDCERFCVDMEKPADYRQAPGANIARKLQRLIEADLIVIDGKKEMYNAVYRRVFKFKFPAMEVA